LKRAKFATEAASTQAAQQQEQIVSNLRQQLSQESDPNRRKAIKQQISDLSGEEGGWKPAKAQVGEDELGEPVYETVLVNDKGETKRIELPEESANELAEPLMPTSNTGQLMAVAYQIEAV
jgi:hypothetical protein